MTSSNFFPRYGKPISRWNTTDPALDGLADELFDEVNKYVLGGGPDEEWPAWPFILIEFPLTNIDALRGAVNRGSEDEVHAILRDSCMVSGGDRFGSEIFGVFGFASDFKLGDLIAKWQARNPGEQPFWAQSLLNQMALAANWEFPKPEWALMKHANTGHWHAPMLLRVRRAPRKQCMQFRIYFPRFAVDETKNTVVIKLPSEEEAESEAKLRLVSPATDRER
jgi:hypothetical protein